MSQENVEDAARKRSPHARVRVMPKGRLRGAVFLTTLVIAAVVVWAPSAAAKNIPGQYIVVLKEGVSEQAAESDAKKGGAEVLQSYHHALNGYAAQMSEAQVAKVKADPRVLSVSPDGEMRLAATKPPPPPSDQPPQLTSFGADRIDADKSSTRVGDGKGSVPVNVAVIDSGIQPDHPDLNVVGGKDCAPGDGYEDRDGHGTMVGGFIGALDNAIGYAGIAPGARLWAVRVARPDGYIANSWLVCGLDFVAASRADADPSNNIAVANMSLGDRIRDDTECASTKWAVRIAVCNIVRAGVVPVAAAGNETVDTATVEPAAWDEVLTVTAMAENDGLPGGLGGQLSCLPFPQSDDTPAVFSNFATLASDQAHTVAAPGVCVPSTYINSAYARSSGTSFAAPLASGMVALCLASGKKPCAGLTPAQVVAKIVADGRAYNLANPDYGFTGDPLHSPDPNRYYGYLIRAGLY
jgi:subtilisin